MKPFFLSFLLLPALLSTSYATTDTSIIDELSQVSSDELAFTLQSFNSCDNFEDVMGNYIKEYWSNNQNNFYGSKIDILEMQDDMMFDSVEESEPSLQKSSDTSIAASE